MPEPMEGALVRPFRGDNRGKRMVRVGPDLK